MKIESYRKFLYLLLPIFIIGSVVIFNSLREKSDIERYGFGFLERLEGKMRRSLVYEKPISMKPGEMTLKNKTIIYILGGNQDSLMRRFRKASSLYHQGQSKKILVLSRPGITEFSPGLGRNLTNDEWSMKELENLNVRKEDIEAIPIQESIFGTFSEAKMLPGIVEGKGFRRLVLVTSSFHTKRVYASFSRFATDRHLELFIYGSDDKVGMETLLSEYIKLFFYDMILLPAT